MADDVRPTIGIEGLFQDFKKPETKIESSIGGFQQTTPDIRYKKMLHSVHFREIVSTPFFIFSPSRPRVDGVTVLSNGLVEVDGAVDAPQFDRASVEPDVGVAEDDFRLVSTGTPSLPPETITRVASTTLLSNFVGGNQRQVGTTQVTTFLANAGYYLVNVLVQYPNYQVRE